MTVDEVASGSVRKTPGTARGAERCSKRLGGHSAKTNGAPLATHLLHKACARAGGYVRAGFQHSGAAPFDFDLTSATKEEIQQWKLGHQGNPGRSPVRCDVMSLVDAKKTCVRPVPPPIRQQVKVLFHRRLLHGVCGAPLHHPGGWGISDRQEQSSSAGVRRTRQS
jgi:hypothetical protein